MDEVTSKLKKLFKTKPKGFKGSGQKLGSNAQQAAPSATSAPARPSQPTPQHFPQQASPRSREKPTPPASKHPLGLRSAPPSDRTDVPPASVLVTGAYIAPEEEEPTEAQEEAFALLRLAPQRGAAAEILSKVLRNIVEHPAEAKYRKLKLNNKKVQQCVVNVDGSLELLQASGFELVFDESSPEPQAAAPSHVTETVPSTEAAQAQLDSQAGALLSESKGPAPASECEAIGYLWFPEEAELWLLQAALQLLRPLTPLPFSKSSTGSTASMRTELLQPQLPFTGQSHTARSSSSGTASSSQPATSHTAIGPATAGINSSSTNTRLDTSSEQAQLSGRSEAGLHDTSAAGRGGQEPPQSGPTASAPINLAEPRPRKTQVPDWVFQQSPVELKQAFMTAKKRREMDSVLMTRAYREKLAGGKTQKGAYIYAVIRVRVPEGLLLQGEFNAREPVTAVFEWVSDCLRDPSLTYELILPTRRPLVTSMGRVSEADLLPSALLNLRFDTPQQMPSLCNTLLQQVE
ncbi:MAG: hypothetical protein FRX49_12333 [Trebouxia sp. A1-2]|nr:MAG: hypothetical protein FRX49_12333 [Trebouxia sp. A1-2]